VELRKLGQDVSGQRVLEGVGLDEDQGLLNVFLFHGKILSLGRERMTDFARGGKW
jgi:hypothetical protein